MPLHHVPLKGASAGTEIISKRVLAPVPQSWFHAARCLLEEQTCSSSARAAWALFWLRPHPKLVCGEASGSDCRPQCPFSLSTTYATMRRAAVWAVVVRSSACASGKGMATVTEGARPDTRQRGAGFSVWRVCVGSGEGGGSRHMRKFARIAPAVLCRRYFQRSCVAGSPFFEPDTFGMRANVVSARNNDTGI